jgi:hypothetical protein
VCDGSAMAHGRGESQQSLGDPCAVHICSARPGAPPPGQAGLENLLGVEPPPLSAAQRRRHGGAEEKRAQCRPETDANPGDQAGRVDAETGGGGGPKKVAGGTKQEGTHDRPGPGRTPGAWGGGTERALLWDSGPGLCVPDPCLPSGDAPRDRVEHCATAVCVALTQPHASSGA